MTHEEFFDWMLNRKRGFKFCGAVCLFLRLNDRTLDEIVRDKNLLTSPDTIRPYLSTEGNNIHIIGLEVKDRVNIRKGLKELIETEHPKSVSWYSKDMRHFREVRCRH